MFLGHNVTECFEQIVREIAATRVKQQSYAQGLSKTTLRSKKGSTFEGEILSIEKRGGGVYRNGAGKCEFSKEDNPIIKSYQGGWKDGVPHGYGVITFRSSQNKEILRNTFEGVWNRGTLLQISPSL